MMDDASNVSSMGGMVSYETASAFDDVVAFYQEQMPANGWTESDDAFISEGTAMFTYAQGDSTVTLMITESDGTVSVLIMSE